MKKLVILLVFVAGCSNTYQNRMNYLYEKLEATKERDLQARQTWESLKEEEAILISRLDDEQLAAYQNMSDIYGTGNPAAEELARRRLEQCLDSDSYVKATKLLQKKHQARLEMDAISRAYRNLRRQGEELGR